MAATHNQFYGSLHRSEELTVVPATQNNRRRCIVIDNQYLFQTSYPEERNCKFSKGYATGANNGKK